MCDSGSYRNTLPPFTTYHITISDTISCIFMYRYQYSACYYNLFQSRPHVVQPTPCLASLEKFSLHWRRKERKAIQPRSYKLKKKKKRVISTYKKNTLSIFIHYFIIHLFVLFFYHFI